MTAAQLTVLLADLALIVVLARLFGRLARYCGQPPVIGEIVAGVLLGPSLFNGAISNTVFPADVRPSLSALANVGLAVFMFVVGLELPRNLLRGRGSLAVTVSFSSIALPFGLGTVLALHLLSTHPAENRLGFVLFLGAAMAVTAFPVLARLLVDLRLTGTPLGGLALTCAAVDDVAAWSLLAVVAAVSDADGPDQWRLLFLLPYLAVMRWIVTPVLRRLTGDLTVPGLAGLLMSAAATEWMGLHFIFGAFLFGVVMPGEGTAALLDRLGQLSSILLLPVFFVVAGLQVDLTSIGWSGFGELGLILLVAIGGKFAGGYLAARAGGVPPRSSAALGLLLNTRGLTELVILSVGMSLGVLDRSLYSSMVVMALVTTAMAGPLLRLLLRGDAAGLADVQRAKVP
ncbi:cation:proton antiporter [Lentzea sp. DG1S-22]|uniref:cation:proton antiporter domain-containing protein n=1 Tax=Lentzea sp. DG1S-22 TaxID=3108822 RepID=UPI002E77CDAF|nr:cation:proton antiporter [Lentzea sp. DG1S-22]WVH77661.1 cation:proton antiporter [Lentzea sp. DG1S-22]